MTSEMMAAETHGGGPSLSRCTKVKAAAAAEEENALKKMKMEDEAKVMAAVEEEEPERKVVEGKRMVKTRMTMKLRKFGIDKIRELQDTIREDLRTKGYVLGWVTDEDE
ncbi:unnamed protein product [Alopecurus aequalis]